MAERASDESSSVSRDKILEAREARESLFESTSSTSFDWSVLNARFWDDAKKEEKKSLIKVSN